ncbi:MAG: enoyl-CoA hydratase-related protein [Pseudobdellovibrio sp.]
MKFIKVENFQANENVKIVSLNRPEVKNAFHPEMIEEITQFFNSESKSETTQLIILSGEGSVFCAGADLNWMKAMVNYTHAENIKDSKKLWEMFNSIHNCSIPVVGLAHGAVYGGALGLLTVCDYVYAEKNTQFCFSEVKLGLAPAMISDFITRKIQDAFVRPLMLSAEVFKTDHAVKIGMVHKSFEEKMSIEEILKNFSANGLEAMRATKKLLNELLQTADIENRKNACAVVITERRMSQEGQIRLKKFLAK